MPRRSTNAFGEPMQGSKIRGAGALARARGYDYGSLSSQQRGAYGSQRNFQAAAETAAARAPTTSSAESEEEREARLKKQGREEVLNRKPEYVQAPAKTTLASRLRGAGEVSLANSGGDYADGLNRAEEVWSKPQMPSTKPTVDWNTPTPSADALRSLRRKINRREQKPSYTASGQVIRGGW